MNISWSDLNNVREAGDYPFRDGTITVSFAEIATWNRNPAARFQLMRKHPLFRYVLGRQIDEKSAPINHKLIYESSNGNSWSLTKDPATGARAVMHRANPQSGGQVLCIGIDKFLSEGASGPEHQALRRLMDKNACLAAILIAYDIHPLTGEAYARLIKTIQSLGVWWHHLQTVWIVQCAYTADEIRERLKSYIGNEDQLLVLDISGDDAKWIGINDAGSKWLADNI